MMHNVRVPILVGVTGHRDPSEATLPALRDAVHEVLTVLRDQTGQGVLYVVTALAEGADQIVADVAVDLGLPLIAVAPMPFAAYAETIEAPQARKHFGDLWARAALTLELPWIGAERSAEIQYEQLAVFLSRQMHLLLALWDGRDDCAEARRRGEPNSLRGGSAHVVSMRREGERTEVASAFFEASPLFHAPPPLLELTRSGPIVHVMTHRGENPATGPVAPTGVAVTTLRWWSDTLPAEGGRKRLRQKAATADPGRSTDWHRLGAVEEIADLLPREWKEIRSLNHVLSGLSADQPTFAAHRTLLCGEDDLMRLQGGKAEGPLAWLRELQAAVDVTAGSYRRLVIGEWGHGLSPRQLWTSTRQRGAWYPSIGALFVFAVAIPFGSISLEIYTHLWRHFLFLLIYLGIVFGSFAFYFTCVRAWRWQERFQDSRALAEALRVQFFWALGGIPVSVSDNYLGHQNDELGWIRQAMRGPAVWATAMALSPSAPNRPLLVANWIDAQRGYFEGVKSAKSGKAWLNERAADTMEKWAVGVLLATVIPVAGLLVFSSGYLPLDCVGEAGSLGCKLENLLIAMLGCFPAVAAFFVVFAEGHLFTEQARAYARAGRVFKQAGLLAGTLRPDDAKGWRDLTIALGREALAENAAWLESHRQRRISYHAGG